MIHFPKHDGKIHEIGQKSSQNLPETIEFNQKPSKIWIQHT